MKPWLDLFHALGLSVLLFASPARGDQRSSAGAGSSLASWQNPLVFAPLRSDSVSPRRGHRAQVESSDQDYWLKTPVGDNLLTHPDQWRSREDGTGRLDVLVDYNRVDRVRLGLGGQIQSPGTMNPRLGARLEYAIDRERVLYGLQIEQPLVRPGRIAIGASVVRRTDHSELQQVEDVENSLALLFARQDYRDYFEREGYGAYLSWRVPDFSTIGVHVRNDRYRSLSLDRGTRSFFFRDRPLRANPAVNEGEAHGVQLRLERLAHRTYRTRAGLYHRIDLERSGYGLGGDFKFTRLLVDLRSVLRLFPATTLSLRGVGGHHFTGLLPVQKQFTAGGVDGLRAHAFDQYRGDEIVLGQAETTIGLWRLRSPIFEGGLQTIAFVDAGRAWFDPEHRWNVGRQHIQTDGGFGLATSEDGLRVYFAKNLRESSSDFVVSVRLQRPF